MDETPSNRGGAFPGLRLTRPRSPCGTQPATTTPLPSAMACRASFTNAAWLGSLTVQLLMTQASALAASAWLADTSKPSAAKTPAMYSESDALWAHPNVRT